MIFVENFYKVVSPKLTSLVHNNHKELTVQYEINKWVYPRIPKSQLFVTDTLSKANDWKKWYSPARIFKCQVICPTTMGRYSRLHSGSSNKVFNFLQNLFGNPLSLMSEDNYLVNAVKLTEEIY